MRGLAREFLGIAHREAEVCCYPAAPPISPPSEAQREAESAGEIPGRSAEPVNSANVTHLGRFFHAGTAESAQPRVWCMPVERLSGRRWGRFWASGRLVLL